MAEIYLDYNATTPVDKQVAEAMRPYLEERFGNPSSLHRFGIDTKKAVEHARGQLAELLNCQPHELVFTSGGSEANNFAIKGAAYARQNEGNHIITSAVEHPAVTEVCKYLEEKGFRVSYIPVDQYGQVHADEVANAITPQTILISVMHANNEVGTIQPIRAIAALAHKHGIFFHVDAAQSVGKIPVDVQALDVDLLSVAGHKFYGPKGIGALFVKTGVRLEKLIHGASHEQNRRAGTENVLEIVGLGKAAALAQNNLAANMEHMKKMRDQLEQGLKAAIKNLYVNGHPEKRLPNTLSISFANLEANTIVSEMQEIAASAGAACHADEITVSPVLSAMGVPLDRAMGTVRFSTGKYTTKEEIDTAIQAITDTINRLQPAALWQPAQVQTGKVRLTQYTHGMGCACKLRPQDLEQVLAEMPLPDDPNVLVGANTSDDAAVYKLQDDLALVKTLDFFTPIVDDPYYFGAIAAANALSDVYAMGAVPRFALNIVGFPVKRLELNVLRQIMKGASDKAAEAGISVLGGHSVEDTEPKFGMVVTGTVHPDKMLSNAGAMPGNALVLTKPLGTGILSTALKRGLLDSEGEQALITTMSALNKVASEEMDAYEVTACTDVTGFGLLGHLIEMTKASGVTAEIFAGAVPVLENVRQLATGNLVPGGTLNNLSFIANDVRFAEEVSQIDRYILADAQTSGGLLVALPRQNAELLLQSLVAKGIEAVVVGRILEKGNGHVYVSP